MHHYDLVLTLFGGFASALVLGYFTQRLGLSPIVGYLIAGTVIGPHTPGFVANAALAEQLAEIGVVLLMFGVGLTFHIKDLLAVKRIAIPGALAQSAVATTLGAGLAAWLGWGWPGGLVFGMALAVASTVVLVRVLVDNKELHTPAGRIAIGWLVVEDLFTVVALVVLPAIFGVSSDSSLALALGWTAIKIGALLAFTAVVGTRVIPRLLDYIARTRSRELFTLTVLALAIGIALGSAMIFDVSMALGAFLAGMVVSRSDYSVRAASEALPLRDTFAALFFVSIGMLLDPLSLLRSPGALAGALAIVLLAKPLIALLIVRLMRYPARVALTVAIALAQIGEFSFILSNLGRDLGLLSDAAANVLVAAAIVSIVLNPLLFRAIRPLERWLNSVPLPETAPPAMPDDAHHRAVVVGYGPTGRTVVRLLRENGIVPTIVDLNMDTVRALRQDGVTAVYGDAGRADILASAGLATAGSLILTSAGMDTSAQVIDAARSLNPDVRVLARVEYLRDLPGLKRTGADSVYSGEGEVALAFVEDILRGLGATAEQIDRERARAHQDLFVS